MFAQKGPKPFAHLRQPSPRLIIQVLAVLCIVLSTILALQHIPSQISHLNAHDAPSTNNRSHLHLLIPASSSNADLCKLQLSITALRYPTPVLINWAAPNEQSHLTKITGVLRYLRTLPASAASDLVLIVDGFDVWFQLPPAVLLARYHATIAAANTRLTARLDAATLRAHKIRQSILFGPDKLCWPEDPRRPACWAVPNSSLPAYALGPATDSPRFRDDARPRWLNSGTIIGPVADVTALLQATVARIRTAYTTDSDQFYLAEMFGAQELARSALASAPLASRMRRVWRPDGPWGDGHYEDILLDVGDPQQHSAAEFHIAVDYESALFQTLSFTGASLSWRRHHLLAPEDFDIDLAAAPPPGVPDVSAWTDVALGTNAVSGAAFPLLHITGGKAARKLWWPRMWFFAHGAAIVRSAQARASTTDLAPLYVDGARGREWWAYRNGNVSGSGSNISASADGAGAYTELGTFMDWAGLCGAHEDAVFRGLPDLVGTPGSGVVKGELKGVLELGLPRVGDASWRGNFAGDDVAGGEAVDSKAAPAPAIEIPVESPVRSGNFDEGVGVVE